MSTDGGSQANWDPDLPTARGTRRVSCVSPVEQVAPWVLREEKPTVLYAANPPPGVFDHRQVEQDEGDDDSTPLQDLKMKMASPPKRVAPLRTHGLLPGQGSLPMLATPPHQESYGTEEGNTVLDEDYTAASTFSPPPPLPLPKSGQSDTMGCADLPPPPPPSHSPDHKYKIQSLLSRNRRGPKQQQQPWSNMPLPPTPHNGIHSPMAPTPISKGVSSASSYPTVSDSAIPASARVRSMSPTYPSSASSRLARKAGRTFFRDSNRPQSAGIDQAARDSLRSPVPMAPSSVGGASKNSFIVFSVNKGSTIDPRASFMTQGPRASQPQPAHQQQHHQQNVTTSPSNYSNTESVFMASPSSPGIRGSNISNYIDMMIPPAPKTAAALPSLSYASARQRPIDNKAHYRRSSSFDLTTRPTKESLRQETMNKPSWFKMTRDREKRRMTEMESEEKIVEAEREIHGLEEEEIEEEDFDEERPQQDWYHHRQANTPGSLGRSSGFDRQEQQEWPTSGGAAGEIMSAGGSSSYSRPRCLSDQPYVGMMTHSPGAMSTSFNSPHSPPSRP